MAKSPCRIGLGMSRPLEALGHEDFQLKIFRDIRKPYDVPGDRANR